MTQQLSMSVDWSSEPSPSSPAVGDLTSLYISAINASLPTYGYRPGTWREGSRRPAAYLYAREMMLLPHEVPAVREGFKRVCALRPGRTSLSAGVDLEAAFLSCDIADVGREEIARLKRIWARLTPQPREAEGRTSTKAMATPAWSRWCIEAAHDSFVAELCERMSKLLRALVQLRRFTPALAQDFRGGSTRVLSPSLELLWLATFSEDCLPMVRLGCELALKADPCSDAWEVLLDQRRNDTTAWGETLEETRQLAQQAKLVDQLATATQSLGGCWPLLTHALRWVRERDAWVETLHDSPTPLDPKVPEGLFYRREVRREWVGRDVPQGVVWTMEAVPKSCPACGGEWLPTLIEGDWRMECQSQHCGHVGMHVEAPR